MPAARSSSAVPVCRPWPVPCGYLVASLKPGEVQIRDLYKNAAGQPSIAFAIPVFAVQGSLGPDAQIGTIIGVKEVAAELFPLLRQPGETSETATATLVRRDGNVIEYLTPLRDGTPPLTLRMATDTAELDATFATASPGGFGDRRDHRGNAVLVTSRRFNTVPWTLMYTIERNEALADADAGCGAWWPPS